MYIYKITNKIDGKIYVGKTKDPDKRLKRHFILAKSGLNRCFYDAIRKDGKENFYMDIIETCDDSIANDREKYWINKLGSTEESIGYNRTVGGDGGNTWILSKDKDKTLKKLSESLKGHRVNMESVMKNAEKRRGTHLKEEQKKKISDTLKAGYASGKIKINVPHHDRTGEHHKESTKIKMSEFRKGKSYEELYGHELSEKIKQSRREFFEGDKNPNYKNVEIDKVIECIKNGMNGKEVAKMFDVKYQTIWYKLKKLGTSINEIRGTT